MKGILAGLASGFVVWVLVFIFAAGILTTVTTTVGSITGTVLAEDVAGIVGPFLCPADSKAEIITHRTTIRDRNNNVYPATAYEMQCVDSRGNIVRAPSTDYAWYWIGFLVVIGLAVSLVLAFCLAAPVGGLIGRGVSWYTRSKDQVGNSRPS